MVLRLCLQRLEILNEIGLLLGREVYPFARIVERDDVLESRGYTVVEVRRVLPQSPERSRAVHLRRAPRREARPIVWLRLADYFGHGMKLSGRIGER